MAEAGVPTANGQSQKPASSPAPSDLPLLPTSVNVVARPPGPTSTKAQLDDVIGSLLAPPPPQVPQSPAVEPPLPPSRPPQRIESPTTTDVDKVDVYRRVMDGDPTVRRVDAQVTRDWITAELAKGNPAVVSLFSKQQLADAGYGRSSLDDVVDNLLSPPPPKSSAPTTLLPVPGTQVVDPTQAQRGHDSHDWVDGVLAETTPPPSTLPPPKPSVSLLPVPITGPAITRPGKGSRPLNDDQVHRLLYGPELSQLAENGGRIVSGLDPADEQVARTSDGRPLPQVPTDPFEAWAFREAKRQRSADQPCEHGGACYRGPKPAELLLGEFRENCTGDPSTPVTAETSLNCLYSDGFSASPPPYFGLAVDEIEPDARAETLQPGDTLESKARQTAKEWFSLDNPTRGQIMQAAQEIVAADGRRFPGTAAIDIAAPLATTRPLLIPASPAEWRNYQQATLDGLAIDNVQVLRRRHAFIHEPMPVAPADGRDPDYYRRGPGGTGYIRATKEEHEDAVAEMGQAGADAMFIPARDIQRRIPLEEADPNARAAAERDYEQLRTSEASNKDYVPSPGLESSRLPGDTRIYVQGSAAQLDWYVRHRGLNAARETFIADRQIPQDIETTATERALYDSSNLERNFEQDLTENVVPMVWEAPTSVGIELWNRTVADPVERAKRVRSGDGEIDDYVGTIPLVGGLPFGPPTEAQEGQGWLEHYAERYPASAGILNFGSDLFQRYAEPAWGGVAVGLGDATGLQGLADHGAQVLRDNRTYVDPLTGETRVGDLKVIRDYRDRPLSALLADATLPLSATGLRLVPVRALAGKTITALERGGPLAAAKTRLGRTVVAANALWRAKHRVTDAPDPAPQTVAPPQGRVVIDHTNASATVATDDGRGFYTYGPGISKRNAAEAIAVDGWRFADGSAWALTSPPDGFWRLVEQDTNPPGGAVARAPAKPKQPTTRSPARFGRPREVDANAAEQLERRLLELPPHRVAVSGLSRWGTRAYFKRSDDDFPYGHAPGQTPRNERAAWRLAVGLHPKVARIVAPVVVVVRNGHEGSLSYRLHGKIGGWRRAPREDKELAAFFDSLIGHQDRHKRNAVGRFGGLGLFDHAFAFRKAGDPSDHWRIFVNWRFRAGRAALTDMEQDMLRRLLASPDLFGVEQLLPPANAAALRERAQQMLARNSILVPEALIRDEAEHAGAWRGYPRLRHAPALAGLRVAEAFEAHGHSMAANDQYLAVIKAFNRSGVRGKQEQLGLKVAIDGWLRTADADA